MIFDLAIGPTSMCATLCRRSVLEVCMYENGSKCGTIVGRAGRMAVYFIYLFYLGRVCFATEIGLNSTSRIAHNFSITD